MRRRSDYKLITSSKRLTRVAMSVTRTVNGYRTKVSVDILHNLQITQADFEAKTYSIEIRANDSEMLLCRSEEGGMPLSGDYTAPIIYSNALGVAVEQILGRTLQVHKTVSFPYVIYDKDIETDESMAVINIEHYQAANDAFCVRKEMAI